MASLDRLENRIPKWISEAITNNKLSHAYIIEGDELSDKAGFSVDLTKAILCEEAPGVGCDNCRSCRMISEMTYRDIYYVSADERSLKDKTVEELQKRLANLPIERSIMDGGRNIAIINNADTMTKRAQNRLLKTLEEPYPGTVIFLLSENSDNLLPTIRSRCQMIRLGDLAIAESTEESSNSEYESAAKSLIDAAVNRKYFFESKNLLDKYLKDRSSAMKILDAMEMVLRQEMLNIAMNGLAGKEERLSFYSRGIRAVESARRDIKYNVREKYALGELVLKIGG